MGVPFSLTPRFIEVLRWRGGPSTVSTVFRLSRGETVETVAGLQKREEAKREVGAIQSGTYEGSVLINTSIYRGVAVARRTFDCFNSLPRFRKGKPLKRLRVPFGRGHLTEVR